MSLNFSWFQTGSKRKKEKPTGLIGEGVWALLTISIYVRVTSIPYPITIRVVLFTVRNVWTVITIIPDPVTICVSLISIENMRAVVLQE